MRRLRTSTPPLWPTPSARLSRVRFSRIARAELIRRRRPAPRSSARQTDLPAQAGSVLAMTSNQEQLEERLGYRFVKAEMLERALTHSSAVPELRANHAAESTPGLLPQDNEQLEFLGDAVLDMLASEYLLAAFPDWSEGQLDRKS